MTADKTFDVAVIGAGVFGAWTAHHLRLAGADVILLDAFGSGNSRSSSGGESRVIRMGYGSDEIYTRSAQRSLTLWQGLFDHVGQPHLFQPTGVLWLARNNDSYCESTLKVFRQNDVKFELLEREELVRRYSQLEFGQATWGILEPDSGVLLARQAVRAVTKRAQTAGVIYRQETIVSPAPRTEGLRGKGETEKPGAEKDFLSNRQTRLNAVQAGAGLRIAAKEFVFACGPWLPKLFPELLSELIQVTRQEVFFFGVPPGDDRFSSPQLPAWIDFNDLVYGIPDLEGRGFKIAIDAHGAQFDPDNGERMASREGLNAVRAYLARHMPALAAAPVSETRVCQYENTSNGDFLIDRHPGFENVWLVGGGSGHGFKHGPAVGEHVAELISGSAPVEPRFSLATKEKLQQRRVY